MADEISRRLVRAPDSALRQLALTLLKEKGSAEAAKGAFASRTIETSLLVALHDITGARHLERALDYLRSVEREREGRGRANHGSIANHREDDSLPPADQSGGASQMPYENHGLYDGTAAPPRNRNQHPCVILGSDDTVPAAAPSAKPPPPTRISKTAALAVATSSIFDREVGGLRKKLGDLTKFDVRQIKRRTIIDGHIADRLLTEINWPDEDKTKLRHCAPEEQAHGIWTSAFRTIDEMGMTNVPG